MHFSCSCFNVLLLAFSTLASAIPSPPTVYNGDGTPVNPPKSSVIANLEGLTHNAHDRSGRKGDPSIKYFHESTFDAHYDGRFASRTLPAEERLIHLRALIRTYLSTMHALHAETWIMHGSLLGWWWNRRVMPWDTDLDVQVSESAIQYLASWYNMTVHTFTDVERIGKELSELVAKGGKRGQRGKKYLLEVNPHYRNPSVKDTFNVIDARWIDIDTGLFIDITALRTNRTTIPSNSTTPYSGPTQMYCKDKHRYLATDIFPLRDSLFENVPVKVPYAYQALLAEEYGEKSLINTVLREEKHFFDQATLEWMPMSLEQIQREQERERAEEEVEKQAGVSLDKGGFEQFPPSRAKKPGRKGRKKE